MAPRHMFEIRMLLTVGLLLAMPMHIGMAADEEGADVEGSGFSMFGTEAIKGYDEKKVQDDPVCDRTKRPRILKVEPDEVKPGDRVVIQGENFGTKQCFHGVSFSKASKAKVEYTFVDESRIEATVPKETPPGMTFVITITGAGSAQSKAVLIKK